MLVTLHRQLIINVEKDINRHSVGADSPRSLIGMLAYTHWDPSHTNFPIATKMGCGPNQLLEFIFTCFICELEVQDFTGSFFNFSERCKVTC